MKRVINSKVYNTETAELLHSYQPYDFSTDFNYFVAELYVTKKGNYFIAEERYGGVENIRPVSIEEAAVWLEETDGHEVLLEDERFAANLEEA